MLVLWQAAIVLEDYAVIIFTLKMEAAWFFKMASYCISTWCQNPKGP